VFEEEEVLIINFEAESSGIEVNLMTQTVREREKEGKEI